MVFIINTSLPNILKKIKHILPAKYTHCLKTNFCLGHRKMEDYLRTRSLSLPVLFHYSPLQSTSTSIKQSEDYHYQHFYEQADQTAKGEHRRAW